MISEKFEKHLNSLGKFSMFGKIIKGSSLTPIALKQYIPVTCPSFLLTLVTASK